MLTINDVVRNCEEIVSVLVESKVKEIWIYKGFDKLEENKLNMLITEYKKDIECCLSCRAFVADELSRLLNCTVFVTDSELSSNLQTQFNTNNSIRLLLDGFSTKESLFNGLRKSLNRVFGESWVFFTNSRYPKEISDEEWKNYKTEMETAKECWFNAEDNGEFEEETKKI